MRGASDADGAHRERDWESPEGLTLPCLPVTPDAAACMAFWKCPWASEEKPNICVFMKGKEFSLYFIKSSV